MNARCQCGSVSFKTPLPKPLALYICHCESCRRQTSSAFGTSAIFPRFTLPETELLNVYARPTASGHTMYCYFCRTCGTRLLHTTPIPLDELERRARYPPVDTYGKEIAQVTTASGRVVIDQAGSHGQ
ncbi:hypothetical protein BN1723_002140 [Verticillium longisporum]|uniref:CENP-V/GFA domain-containing protein n=1 Tax=Verticillium longisporum TaxID=100787 RepID=A0A0G4KZW4_VERLO|nr:hypothetical protein BN1723_002140 [Verticillium longisporum]